MKISACWITKNEADNLRLSIDSVKSIVDEIIVVDTGSTDNTVEVAKELGAQVHYFEWIGDFSAARNYTISLLTGDIAFFLDADEYFLPAFLPKDRKAIESLYESPNIDGVSFTRHNVQITDQKVISVDRMMRMFRNNGQLAYKDKIHESLQKKNGLAVAAYFQNNIIMHNGYAPGLLEEKCRRNIQLLEETLETTTAVAEQLSIELYLMREYQNIKDEENAFRYLTRVLQHSNYLGVLCNSYQFLARFLQLIVMISKWANRLDTGIVKEKLLPLFQKHFSDCKVTPFMEIYCEILFGFRDEIILEGLDKALQLSETKTDYDMDSRIRVELTIYSYVAAFYARNGDMEKVFDYTVKYFTLARSRTESSFREDTLFLLLRCIRGQNAKDIILFLNSIFDTQDSHILKFLANGCLEIGLREPYLYYMLLQIKHGTATKGDFLLFQMLENGYLQSTATALSMLEDADSGVVADHLFIAAICSSDETIYHNNRELLAPYSAVLDAFFAGNRLEKVDLSAIFVLHAFYSYIIFAGGEETAARFLAVFSNAPTQCFQCESKYWLNNGNYQKVLDRDLFRLDPDKWEIQYPIVLSYMMTGLYSQALDILKRFMYAPVYTGQYPRTLYLFTRKSSGSIQQEAAEMYRQCCAAFDEILTYQGVFLSLSPLQKQSKKESARIRAITLGQFRKDLEADRMKFTPPALLSALETAAEYCQTNELFVTEGTCYRRLIASNYNSRENTEKLAGLFETHGNERLADYVRRLA